MKPKKKLYKCPCNICAATRAIIVKDPFNRKPARAAMEAIRVDEEMRRQLPAPAKAP